MKKIGCLLLVMMLCTVGALASSVPSKVVSDMTQISVNIENATGMENAYVAPVAPAVAPTAEEIAVAYEEIKTLTNLAEATEVQRVAVADAELKKVAETATVAEYFGAELTTEINAILGVAADEEVALNMHEMLPVQAEGFAAADDFGNVTATMLFATPYEAGQPVVVLVGVVTMDVNAITGETEQNVTWKAFEGTVLEPVANNDVVSGCIQVTFDEETVKAVETGLALMSVVSK